MNRIIGFLAGVVYIGLIVVCILFASMHEIIDFGVIMLCFGSLLIISCGLDMGHHGEIRNTRFDGSGTPYKPFIRGNESIWFRWMALGTLVSGIIGIVVAILIHR